MDDVVTTDREEDVRGSGADCSPACSLNLQTHNKFSSVFCLSYTVSESDAGLL